MVLTLFALGTAMMLFISSESGKLKRQQLSKKAAGIWRKRAAQNQHQEDDDGVGSSSMTARLFSSFMIRSESPEALATDSEGTDTLGDRPHAPSLGQSLATTRTLASSILMPKTSN